MFGKVKTAKTSINITFSGTELGIKETFNVEDFKKKLERTNSNAAWLTHFEKVQEIIVPRLHEISFTLHDSVEFKCEFETVFENLSVTTQEVTNIEKLTRGQS